jgi:ubiquinone/menaquinone biosynthesis C-methylase UbiE
MKVKGFKDGWMAVDAGTDPHHYVRLADIARGGREDEPAQYSNLFDALGLSEGERVLDVGCGTGGAVRTLAASFPSLACVVGVDLSETMITEARARTGAAKAERVEFVLGDAHALPFSAGTFDAVFSLRVFEIIGEPRRALAEMARVLRPDGRLVINGPDMDAWAIDSSDREVTRKILHHASDVETNGWVGRQLPAWCKELGLTDVRATPVGVAINEFGALYEICLRAFVENAVLAGTLTVEEAAHWVEDLRDRDRRGHFFCSQTFFRITARKK